jgi:hypothetical protein
MMHKFCPKCGYSGRVGAAFCGRCGTSLKEEPHIKRVKRIAGLIAFGALTVGFLLKTLGTFDDYSTSSPSSTFSPSVTSEPACPPGRYRIETEDVLGENKRSGCMTPGESLLVLLTSCKSGYQEACSQAQDILAKIRADNEKLGVNH